MYSVLIQSIVSQRGKSFGRIVSRIRKDMDLHFNQCQCLIHLQTPPNFDFALASLDLKMFNLLPHFEPSHLVGVALMRLQAREIGTLGIGVTPK